jgi:hypothetical protein
MPQAPCSENRFPRRPSTSGSQARRQLTTPSPLLFHLFRNVPGAYSFRGFRDRPELPEFFRSEFPELADDAARGITPILSFLE